MQITYLLFVCELRPCKERTDGRTDGQDRYCGLLGRPYNNVVSYYRLSYIYTYTINATKFKYTAYSNYVREAT